MPKDAPMMTHQLTKKLLKSSLYALLTSLAVACGAPDEAGDSTSPVAPNDPFEGIEEQLTQPTNPCTFNATTGVMTVIVDAGETIILSKRVADANILQNGYGCVTAVNASTLKQIVVTGSPGDETVIVDFSNGVFATGTTSATSGISVNMGGSSGGDSFGVRGTTGADTITLGA